MRTPVAVLTRRNEHVDVDAETRGGVRPSPSLESRIQRQRHRKSGMAAGSSRIALNVSRSSASRPS